MDEPVRLNKFLSDKGICSRREADRLVEMEKILVNNTYAQKGQKVLESDEIVIDGKRINGSKKDKKIVMAFHKPVGIICTASKEKNNIIDYINYPTRIYPIGRLDKDSEGLILLTNDGSIVNLILKSRNNHEKEYVVTINKPVTEAFLKKMQEGVEILDVVTKPCKAWKIDTNTFHIVLTQGLNRQIRRMCKELGATVTKLKRIRIMHIKLDHLPVGKWRLLSDEEIKKFR